MAAATMVLTGTIQMSDESAHDGTVSCVLYGNPESSRTPCTRKAALSQVPRSCLVPSQLH
jgi:hypothetical protein